MNASVSTAALGNHVVESLLGYTGEPKKVAAAARALGLRVRGEILNEVNERLAYSVDMEFLEPKVTRLEQALPSEPSNIALCVASSGTSPDALTMTLDTEAIALLVSAAFGGDPDIAVMPIERGLTSIELALVANVFEVVAKAFDGSGSRALGIELPLAEVITGIDLPRMTRRDGPAVALEFRIHSPIASGVLTVLMPQRILLAHRADVAVEAEEPQGSAHWRNKFSEEVMRASVSLEAAVPMSRYTLGDISKWQVGQVLEMPENAQAQTRLSARRKTIFICEFGKLGNRFTVRVGQPFDAGKEFIDRLMKMQDPARAEAGRSE
jgi:flagellar motor switch protein FliM